ncbi:PREDICTED: pickpocket protein 28 [Drosophila arizonae]|uniref:Pickpocket protein 28 n=1 Tax=Drosophila arizonae TaxID=7263 RepID=A0ABM1P0N1_DROAR|nr:PREDICTED: pickpocket protein 28 [Drosophila arizonae]
MWLRKVLKLWWQSFERRSKEFLRSTSLQGLKYVWNNELPGWVQLYFVKVFIVAVYVAINLAVNVFHKWQSTPVIIGISPTVTAIQSIPFPAITVCSMNKAKSSIVSTFQNGSLEHAMLQKACNQEFNYTRFSSFRPRLKRNSFADFIFNISHKCDEMMVSCEFGQKTLPCTDLFREIYVDEGLCCVFNFLHPYYLYKHSDSTLRDYTSSKGLSDIAVDWNPITGYPKYLPAGYYPRPGLGMGIYNGLKIVLNGFTDEYYCSSTNGQGFKVLLYNSIDQPRLKESGLPIMLGHETNYRIVPNSYEAVPSIRNIDRMTRKCIFSDEQKLLFYKYYTRRNCEAECDAIYFLRLCDCIPYYLPLIYRNATVCHVAHFDCVNRAELGNADGESTECKELCLTGCHDVTYFPNAFSIPIIPFQQDSVSSQGDFFKNFSTDFIVTNLAIVNFYHDDNYFRSHVRSSYTGLTEYMSLTGGIMSLMFGFSVVFLAELFYFIFLRSLFQYIQHWSPNRRNRVNMQYSDEN